MNSSMQSSKDFNLVSQAEPMHKMRQGQALSKKGNKRQHKMQSSLAETCISANTNTTYMSSPCKCFSREGPAIDYAYSAQLWVQAEKYAKPIAKVISLRYTKLVAEGDNICA